MPNRAAPATAHKATVTKAWAPAATSMATRAKAKATQAPTECTATSCDTPEATLAVTLIYWQATVAFHDTPGTSTNTPATPTDTSAAPIDTPAAPTDATAALHDTKGASLYMKGAPLDTTPAITRRRWASQDRSLSTTARNRPSASYFPCFTWNLSTCTSRLWFTRMPV